jgi:uncharacterized protein YjiS (DUF1127 family)
MSIAIPRTHRSSSWLRTALNRAVSAVRRWWQWRTERWELLSMDERELRDIGLTRTDARRLAGQPMWRR